MAGVPVASSAMRLAKPLSCAASAASGLPVANWGKIECSAMAATAATTLKPQALAVSSISARVSSYARLP